MLLFLIFERQSHSEGIQVRSREEDLWLTQKGIADLYDVDRTVITKHLKNIYADLELEEKSTSAIFALVQKEGNREVERKFSSYFEGIRDGMFLKRGLKNCEIKEYEL